MADAAPREAQFARDLREQLRTDVRPDRASAAPVPPSSVPQSNLTSDQEQVARREFEQGRRQQAASLRSSLQRGGIGDVGMRGRLATADREEEGKRQERAPVSATKAAQAAMRREGGEEALRPLQRMTLQAAQRLAPRLLGRAGMIALASSLILLIVLLPFILLFFVGWLLVSIAGMALGIPEQFLLSKGEMFAVAFIILIITMLLLAIIGVLSIILNPCALAELAPGTQFFDFAIPDTLCS